MTWIDHHLSDLLFTDRQTLLAFHRLFYPELLHRCSLSTMLLPALYWPCTWAYDYAWHGFHLVLQTSGNLSCMYSSRALFYLMKETNDPLYEKLYDQSYRFPSVESLNQVSSHTQILCKKYFHEYWNQGGREHAFMKAKQKMKKVCYLYVIFDSLFFPCVFSYLLFYFALL
jgi:hypothetical protein